jgi:hypothetical protein
MNDTSPEMEKIHFQMMMKLTPNERIGYASEMFMAARKMIFASLPAGLSDKEKIKRYYQQLYDEPLPDDFFKD